MSTHVSAEDGRQSLTTHVEAKGAEVFARYGPRIGWNELQRLLADRSCVRYPCEIAFDRAPLHPGEFAYPVPCGKTPEDGFTLYIDPYFLMQPDKIPHLALYQMVLVNYGEFASADDAETFGAAALGLSKEQYYQELCALVDEISGEPSGSPPA